jgi:GTPase SAR1 family protein
MLQNSPSHHKSPPPLSITLHSLKPHPIFRRHFRRPSKSLKILIAGDWFTESPHRVQQYDGIDVNLWFIPTEGLTNPAISRSYYAGAVGALIVFDFSRPSSLATAQNWKKDIEKRVLCKGIPCLLLGNRVNRWKADEWKKSEEEMDLFVTENGFRDFMRICELNAVNLNRAVKALVGYVKLNSIEAESEGPLEIQMGEREEIRAK